MRHTADLINQLIFPLLKATLWESNRGGTDKGGGGLAMFYKSSLVAHEHNPDVPAEYAYIEKERQWLLIADGDSGCAFLRVYIAC